jgi:hypothetical protein
MCLTCQVSPLLVIGDLDHKSIRQPLLPFLGLRLPM